MERLDALATARALLDDRLRNAIHDHPYELRDAIRAAGEPIWSEITEQAAKLDGVEIENPDALLRAAPDAQAAWLQLAGLARQYYKLRAALTAIPWDDEKLQRDIADTQGSGDHHEFAEGKCRLLGPGWNGAQGTASMAPRMPWDQDDKSGRSRLLYFARHPDRPTPHWPSPSEQDEAWLADPVHAERARAFDVQQSRHGGVHAMGA